MIFRRKAKGQPTEEPEELAGDEALEVTEADPDDEVAEAVAEVEDDPDAEVEDDPDAETASDSGEETDDADEDDEFDGDEEDQDDGQEDPRVDGPFDFDEVDLGADEVQRMDLGSLILTPWEGMGLQLHVNEATQQVVAALAFWEQSGLELALLAAPTSGGLAEELREDLTEEAEQAGGSATTVKGPFGPELRRVLPVEGPNGEQLFQVSRTWFAEGPRWLLRGTLLGEAGLTEAAEGASAPFVEFFRNVVVRRGDGPMVPGEVIAMTMQTVPQG